MLRMYSSWRDRENISVVTSEDGARFTRTSDAPVLRADEPWEQAAVMCPSVLWDGVTGWERSADNPIIAPDEGAWDGDACYKPFVLDMGGRWMLWYNGRRGTREQIGAAVLEGELGF